MTRNPWPENSDYGKLWRKGHDAGRADQLNRLLPAFVQILERQAPLPTPTDRS